MLILIIRDKLAIPTGALDVSVSRENLLVFFGRFLLLIKADKVDMWCAIRALTMGLFPYVILTFTVSSVEIP